MQGFLTLSSVVHNGQKISPRDALKRGALQVASESETPSGWGIGSDEIPLGWNLMVDGGRQFLAYLFGGKSAASSFCVSRFGIGTGNLAPNVSNTDLQAPISFYDPTGTYGSSSVLIATKPITTVTYPAPMIALVQIDLAAAEANGYLITEWGLYASADSTGTNNTLLNRKIQAGWQKDSTSAPTFAWRVRL